MTTPLRIAVSARGVRLDLRVMPRSPQSRIDGIRDGRLLVRVTAPPVDRAANDAVVALLAATLAVPRRDVALVSGQSARNKTVEIDGLDEATLRARLERALAD
jgi:hypothetical protein